MAVFPSPESETDVPCLASAYRAGADQFRPCWLHTPAERVNTHAAPHAVVIRPTHDGGIPVTGKRDGRALLCGAYSARADQFGLAGSTPRPSA